MHCRGTMGLLGTKQSCIFDLYLVTISLMILGVYATCPSVCNCRVYSTGKMVHCQGENLTAIPAGLPFDTVILQLGHNKLTRLEADAFSGLRQLRKLYLYNNEIVEIEDGAFRGLPNVKHLDLTSNKISVITNRTFEGIPYLERLNLGNNLLSSLPSGVFRQVPLLLELELRRNNIHEFPVDVSRDLVNVEILDLSFNPASLLLTPIFGQMVALQHLKLNYLFDVNSALVEDSISESAFDGLSNLTNLELNGNRLTKIPSAVKSLPYLTSIELQSNSIRTINADDFYRPILLEVLDLSYNSLVELPTSALAEFPHLTDLILDFNPISVIGARAFFYNPHLATLYMAYTNLTTINEDAFMGLGRLDTLYLKGNNLTTVVDGAMNYVNPEVNLIISGNPIRCDCHLRGFAAWLKNNHNGTVNRGSPLQCVTPDRLNDSSVVDLLPNKFACEPRSTSPNVTVSVHLETNALLACAIDADPILQSFWITKSHGFIYPDQPQPPFAMADNGSLLITNVSLSNEGLYTCVVSNHAGEAQSSVELRILLSPVPEATATPTATPFATPTSAPTAKPTGNNLPVISIFVISGILFFVMVVLLVLIRRGTIARNKCFKDKEHGQGEVAVNIIYNIPNGHTNAAFQLGQPEDDSDDENYMVPGLNTLPSRNAPAAPEQRTTPPAQLLSRPLPLPPPPPQAASQTPEAAGSQAQPPPAPAQSQPSATPPPASPGYEDMEAIQPDRLIGYVDDMVADQ
ncbi:leucine-rich repeat-containing protein 24-like [Patiria miniata]|uniref:Ig-like domain-containing protein n=1 Tax=Patiria miniata TaxID=46514 RepID=A0A914A242_PATMI|nr:leucine-rich repeat-containing protein 24-like [Patiria miniata]